MKSLHYQAYNQVRNQIFDQVKAQARNQIFDQVADQVYFPVNAQLWLQVMVQFSN